MAQIAEDLFLLLLDNASAQPGLDSPRCEHVLAAATLLDLAYACRVRPAVDGEPVKPGRLVALDGSGPLDPVIAPAFGLLRTKPLRPGVAIKKLGKDTQRRLPEHLEQAGHIRRTVHSSTLTARTLTTRTLTAKTYAFPMNNRERVGAARAALLAALFDRRPPTATTAAIVTVLHTVDGLGALLSLNDRGWRFVHARAGEIAAGNWVDESPAGVPEINLAVTAAAVRQALAALNRPR